MKNISKTFTIATVIAAGCTTEPTELTSTVEEALTSDNGLSLNGLSLNGLSLNGLSLNGLSLNGLSLNGLSLNGLSLNGLSLNGPGLNGLSLNGLSLNGTDFVGAVLNASLSNGASLTLRIDDIDPLSGTNHDVLAYEVSASVDSGWTSICGYETDGTARRALAVPGTWNLVTGAWSDDGTMFTFACRKASIAKCVELGYKAWNGLSDHHHACVRMLRADYCGDGTPHTVDGTLINLYDNVGVQTDTESWPVDAEWTPDGASCLKHYRGSTRPVCYAEKFTASCGTFNSGALLINEYRH